MDLHTARCTIDHTNHKAPNHKGHKDHQEFVFFFVFFVAFVVQIVTFVVQIVAFVVQSTRVFYLVQNLIWLDTRSNRPCGTASG